MEHIDTDLDITDEGHGIHPIHDEQEHGLFMEHIAQGDHGLLYLDTILHEMNLT